MAGRNSLTQSTTRLADDMLFGGENSVKLRYVTRPYKWPAAVRSEV